MKPVDFGALEGSTAETPKKSTVKKAPANRLKEAVAEEKPVKTPAKKAAKKRVPKQSNGEPIEDEHGSQVGVPAGENGTPKRVRKPSTSTGVADNYGTAPQRKPSTVAQMEREHQRLTERIKKAKHTAKVNELKEAIKTGNRRLKELARETAIETKALEKAQSAFDALVGPGE